MHPDDLPTDLPAGLELTTVDATWFRFDRQPPSGWGWNPFPTPRHRFDSISGRHRMRYAASSFAGAARERFDASGRVISTADGDQWMVELTGQIDVVDLRVDATLDALKLDDRVSTGRLALDRRDGDAVLDTCGTLTDRLVEWFGDDIHGVVYRSRTTPQRSVNLAMYQAAPLQVAASTRVRELGDDRFTELVLKHGFYIEGLLGE